MSQSPQHFHVPRKPRTSSTALTVGILIILALLVGGGFAIHLLWEQQNTPPKVTEVVVQKKAQLPGPAKPARPASSGPVTLPSEPVATSAPVSSEIGSEEWERVQETYRTSPPQLAIVALNDFVETSPKSTFIPTAKSQIDDALDRLWWIRIKGLCDERDGLSKKIDDIDNEIDVVKKNGAVEQRIAELQKQNEPLANQRDVDQQHLAQMKYTDSRVPDLYDDAQLAELRNARDVTTYEQWKKKTFAYIERNRGKLPW